MFESSILDQLKLFQNQFEILFTTHASMPRINAYCSMMSDTRAPPPPQGTTVDFLLPVSGSPQMSGVVPFGYLPEIQG